MFHNYAGKTSGKGGEMYSQIIHERCWSAKLLRDVYCGFLTKREIKDMLNNKDLWMDGKEVLLRLEKRSCKLEKREAKKKAKVD
jgi:hypothetical protein